MVKTGRKPVKMVREEIERRLLAGDTPVRLVRDGAAKSTVHNIRHDLIWRGLLKDGEAGLLKDGEGQPVSPVNEVPDEEATAPAVSNEAASEPDSEPTVQQPQTIAEWMASSDDEPKPSVVEPEPSQALPPPQAQPASVVAVPSISAETAETAAPRQLPPRPPPPQGSAGNGFGSGNGSGDGLPPPYFPQPAAGPVLETIDPTRIELKMDTPIEIIQIWKMLMRDQPVMQSDVPPPEFAEWVWGTIYHCFAEHMKVRLVLQVVEEEVSA